MNNQKGFISLGILLAIILAVAVVGGGAYYMEYQSAAQATQSTNPDISTVKQTLQETTNTSVQATANTPKQTTQSSGSTGAGSAEIKSSLSATPASGAAPLTVNFSGTFDTKVTGDAGGNYIDFGDAAPNCNSSGDPCFSSVADTNPNCATNGTCTLTAISHTYQAPGTYTAKLMNNNLKKIDNETTQGKIVGSIVEVAEAKIVVTASKANIESSGPSAMIDQSSLASASTPKLSGTLSGTSDIIVAVWQGNLSPSGMNYSTNSKAERWASNTQIRNPEVSVSGGRWSTSIGNSEVAGLGGPIPYFPNGVYTVSISDANTGKILATGTLQITGPSIEVTRTDTATVTFSYVDLPSNSQILLAGQSNNPPVVATVSGTGSSSFSVPNGIDGTYWLQVWLNGNANNILQSGAFSANWTGR